jgi:hypothetical protein
MIQQFSYENCHWDFSLFCVCIKPFMGIVFCPLSKKDGKVICLELSASLMEHPTF